MLAKNVFSNVKSFDEMVNTIIAYGKSSEDYNVAVGSAYEVFAEFYLEYFGPKNKTHMNIMSVMDTSDRPMQEGYDFSFYTHEKQQGLIQVKFRSDPTYHFSSTDLASFISMCDCPERGSPAIPRERRILFTNLDHNPHNSDDIDRAYTRNCVFDMYYDRGLDQIGWVIDGQAQRNYTSIDKEFWRAFKKAIAKSGKPRKIVKPHPLREYQQELVEFIVGVSK